MSEAAANGSIVGTVLATDPDAAAPNAALAYAITAANPAAVGVSATGDVTATAPANTVTQVTVSSPGFVPWTTAVSIRTITDITAPHLSAQSISASDDFSTFGSNAGLPTTSYYADVYRITLPAGELEITMDTGDGLDSYLLLANAQGFLVAGNDDDDDGVLGVGSRIRYTVTTPGTYYIEASTFNGLDTGNYTFEVKFTAAGIDVGAFSLNGSCGTPGVTGAGFLLTAATAPLPAGTTILVNGSGVSNIGVFSVSGGTASIAILSATSRLITLTSALPAGQTMSFRTTLSITNAFTLNGVTSLPGGYIGTGAKPTGAVNSTLVLCSTT